MKTKFFTLIFVSILCFFGAKAQGPYPVVKIHDIQFMSQNTLDSCNFVCKYNNDTVTVRGICVMAGDLSTAYYTGMVPTTREVYLQDGSGANSGIDVFTLTGGTVTSPQDIYSLLPGDSIAVTGLISVYDGQIEIEPIITTAGGVKYTKNVTYLGHSKTGPKYTTVPVGQMVNSTGINQLSTGEQWESVYIQLQNVTVTDVLASASTGGRVGFYVSDSAGNTMEVYDRFLVQRNSVNGNTFKVPHIGDIFKTLRGVVSGYASSGVSCTSGTYELYPFDTSDYVYSLSAPIINFVTRNHVVPTSSQAVTISANVTAFGTRGIKNVMLYYKTGTDTSLFSGYTAVNMTLTGANYVATIPAEANGTSVKYWVTAVDTISASPLRSYSPNIKAANTFAYFYTVRNSGLSIYDLQYRPLAAAISPYFGDTVTVSGVVTASLKDLGYFYIQEPGLSTYAGIELTGSTSLATYKTGNYVTVTGIVNEASSYTSIEVISIDSAATNPYKITPITILDSLLNSGTEGNLNYRKYMAMLSTLKSASGGKMYVIQKNADPTYNPGFGDFRVGESTAKTLDGTRVTAGNASASDPSTENLSYINDSAFGPNLKVPKWRIIQVGDNMDSITGIMFYNYSNYKLLPRTNADMYGINNPVVISTSNIEPIAPLQGNIEIYPNPSNGMVHIDLIDYKGDEAVTVNVYDVAGKSVYTNNLSSSEPRYDLNLNLNAGAYIMTLNSVNGFIGETKLLISK